MVDIDPYAQAGTNLHQDPEDVRYSSNYPLSIAKGGTGADSAQSAINFLSSVDGGGNEYVLTKDTTTGDALWKEAQGGWADMTEAVWEGGTQSEVTDGVGKTAFAYDTDNSWLLGDIASWSNAGDEKISFNANGDIYLHDSNKITFEHASSGETATIEMTGSSLNFNRSNGTINMLQAFAVGATTASGTGTASYGTNGIWQGRTIALPFIISAVQRSSNAAPQPIQIYPGNADPNATTNITGEKLSLIGGKGAANSIGAAHGGDVEIGGGEGFGTGLMGNIIISNIRTSDPGIPGALWDNAGIIMRSQ